MGGREGKRQAERGKEREKKKKRNVLPEKKKRENTERLMAVARREAGGDPLPCRCRTEEVSYTGLRTGGARVPVGQPQSK